MDGSSRSDRPGGAADSVGAASAIAGGAGAQERRLARGFFGLAGLTYGLIVLGALVRAHGAGLSCPDWPLCFGEVIPRLDFKVAFEFGHRVVAGSVAILFALLAWRALRSPIAAGALRGPLALAAFLLAVQIVLGGLTVLELLATWTVTSHLVTGNAFALALVLIGRRLAGLATPIGAPSVASTQAGAGRVGGEQAAAIRAASKTGPTPGARGATSLVGLLLLAQLIVGGLVSSSYAGLVCPDWPTCMNGEYFPTFTGIQGLHVLHRTLAYTLVAALPVAAWIARPSPELGHWLRLASGLVLCQVAVGVTNVLLRLPVEITALHSALAAALVCTVGIAVSLAWRRAAI